MKVKASIEVAILIVIVAVEGFPISDDVCASPACIEGSMKILSRMNQSVDPCEDFYEFACGNFTRETVIPDDKTAITSFSLVIDEVRDQLHTILKQPEEETQIAPFRNAKKLFNICMKTEKIEQNGLKPLHEVLKRLGGWPVIARDTWNESSWSWQKFDADVIKMGFPVETIFHFDIKIDITNTKRRSVVVDQHSEVGLEREYLVKKLENPFVQAYHKYQVDVAVLLGAERSYAEKELRKALEFEFKLVDISKSRTEKRHRKFSVDELQKNVTCIDWLSYINGILPDGVSVDDLSTVYSYSHDYLYKVCDVLNSSSKREIANYVLWKVIVRSIKYLPKSLRQLQFELINTITGQMTRMPRWKECVDVVEKKYPIEVGSLYVRKYFNESSKAKAVEMIEYIKNEFQENLEENDWMDEVTRREALQKLKTLSQYIGFAEELLDDEKLIEYHSDFPEPKESQYFHSILELEAARNRRSFSKLNSEVDKFEWSEQVSPSTVNAYYAVVENKIIFPAGILQGDIFSTDLPQYENFGALGHIIGHEITEFDPLATQIYSNYFCVGFDVRGSYFDADGQIRDWWQDEARQKFSDRADCIRQQYNNYTEPSTGLSLNGNVTDSENIADNGGIKYAYRGYLKWVEKNGVEPGLPGLSFTPNQLFWISSGQNWCAVYREKELRQLINVGTHTLARFRVIGSMSNSKEFNEDFKCPVSSKMNPKDKCELW